MFSEVASTVQRWERVGGDARPSGEVFFRRALVGFSILGAIALAVHLGVGLWSANEFTQPESIVATQSTMLARTGTLYYDLRRYPYTVCAYTPLFYLAEAGLFRLGLPPVAAGRLISFAALLAILWLVGKILLLYTSERYCAWTGVVLCAATQLLLGWGTVGQVDILALAMTLGAFERYSRYRVLGEETIWQAGFLAIAALMTKQTVLAAPATIFLLLLLDQPKKALLFGGIVGGAGGGLVLGLNAAMEGRFLANTVFANMNPFAWVKLRQHFDYASVALAQPLLVTLAGIRRACQGKGAAPFVYLGFALLVLLATAGKVGSDSNYQLETAVLLVLCACLSAHALEFFPLFFRGSKSWVTLLILPLGLHAVLNLRVAAFVPVERQAKDRIFQDQVARLQPYLQGDGRVLTADVNAVMRARRILEVEPLIYRLLVEAGRLDPEPLRRDLEGGAFSAVLLYEDLSKPPDPDPDPEMPRLPAVVSDTIRKNYRLVEHLPGPYLEGVYVYQPVKGRKS